MAIELHDLKPAPGAHKAVGAVRDNELVKVLGTGELTVKVDLVVDAWSKSAQEKIEKAGGSVTKR